MPGVFARRSVRTVFVLVAVLAFFAGSAGVAFSQAGGTLGNVNGRILSNTGTPVAGAEVDLASPSGSYHQKSDGQGYFHFLGVQVDTYVLSVKATGFSTLTQAGLSVTGNSNVDLGSVRLSIRVIGSTTARSPSSAFVPNQTIPQYTLSGATLENALGKNASSNESQALLAIPGFQQDAMGNLILEGSTTDQVHYQFDGVDFTDPGFSRSINQNFLNGISTIQVVPGAGDPSQGNSGAGVVNLVVKRGTYPPSGLFDAEALTNPYNNQVNLQYGIASPNGRFSDYFSEFATAYRFQYGGFNSSSFSNGVAANYGASYEATNDFINNFVYRFGQQNNQSLQFLYYAHADSDYANYGKLPLDYEDGAPDVLLSETATTGLTIPQIQQVQAFDQGQTSVGERIPSNETAANQSQLLKFEYDNQFDADTQLQLRFFHSNNFSFTVPSESQTAPASNVNPYGQTAGGSRTGANFALSHQFGPKNLVTLSGSYEFNRPNFGVNDPEIGVIALGPNAQDFLVPADYGAPISAANPCPANYSAANPGCYLYSTLLAAGKLPASAANFPKVPPLALSSYELQKEYGVGLRDQVTVTSKLHLDLGLREDLINNGYGSNLYSQDVDTQPVPGAPQLYSIANYGFVEQPHFLEPRAAASYRLDPNDNISFTYGRSINLSGSGELASPENFEPFAPFANVPVNPNSIPYVNPFTGQPGGAVGGVTAANCYPTIPYPVGAGPSTPPSYAGKVGTNLQLGKPCANYGEQLYQMEDAYYPEVTAIQPSLFDNFDLTYSHLFQSGIGLRINPYARQGYDIEAITAPLVFNPSTGLFQPGSLVNQSSGRSTVSGAGVQITLPDRRQGLTGFVSLSYINEFVNTPAAGDNPAGQDFEPLILPQSLAAGNLYRAGFVSPFTVTIGPAYKTRSGFRINPTFDFNDGYPYNAGLTTPSFFYLPTGTIATNVPNTNVSDQYGPSGAPLFVDPANPGSEYAPVIAANRGTKESAASGGLLSKPQVISNLTIEYTHPGSRSTVGAQVIDLFNNGIYLHPSVNTNYYPVTSGVAGPLTGQGYLGAEFPQLAPLVATATSPYKAYTVAPFIGGPSNIALPLTFRLYYQLAL